MRSLHALLSPLQARPPCEDPAPEQPAGRSAPPARRGAEARAGRQGALSPAGGARGAGGGRARAASWTSDAADPRDRSGSGAGTVARAAPAMPRPRAGL